MKKYSVIITETLERSVDIDAKSEEDALNIAEKEYSNGDHVLTYEDHINTSFSTCRPQKIYLKYMEDKEKYALIKKNKILMEMLQRDLYDVYMFDQMTTGEYMLGKDVSSYIDIKDHYSTFFLVLKDWKKFINNLDKDYLSNDALNLYNIIIKKRDKLYNMEQFTDKYNKLEEEIENNCKELLKLCESFLHEYESYPDEDDAIRYAEEMERLNDYYIEMRENGTTDNVIRRDVAYTETFI